MRCMVVRELLSKRVMKLWADELGSEPPFNTGKDALFVAFFASAELGCFRSLGWDSPYWVLDFCPEIRNLTNGMTYPGIGLVSICFVVAISTGRRNTITLNGAPYENRTRVSALRGPRPNR